MLKSRLIKLHAAALIFASRKNCSAQEIADVLKVPVSLIYRVAKEPEWDEALDALKFTGERKFATKKTRDAQRDAPELVAQARALYDSERRRGQTHKKAVTHVSETLTVDRRRINNWAAAYNWETPHGND